MTFDEMLDQAIEMLPRPAFGLQLSITGKDGNIISHNLHCHQLTTNQTVLAVVWRVGKESPHGDQRDYPSRSV